MKTCSKCGVEQSDDQFNKQTWHCKQCAREYNVINKEHNNIVSAQYYAIHKLEILARKKAIYLDQHPRKQRPKATGWQPLTGRHADIERQIRQYAMSH